MVAVDQHGLRPSLRPRHKAESLRVGHRVKFSFDKIAHQMYRGCELCDPAGKRGFGQVRLVIEADPVNLSPPNLRLAE
jgi:hypothetical protein